MSAELISCKTCPRILPINSFPDAGYGYRKRSCNFCRNERIKTRHATDPIFRETRRALSKTWYHAHKNEPDYVRARKEKHIRQTYGLSPQEYTNLLQSQNGLCALCGKNLLTNARACVDHNHKTNQIRALLCIPCNIDVGFIETRSQDHFARVKAYIAHYAEEK